MPGYQDIPTEAFESIVQLCFGRFQPPEELVEDLVSCVVPAASLEEFNAADFVHRILREPRNHLVQRAPEGTQSGRGPQDSDNSDINEPESRNDSLLQKVKSLYERFAKERLRQLRLRPLQLKHVFEYMNIDRIAPTEECKAILLPFNCLKVIIAHRRVIFEFWDSAQPDGIHKIIYSSVVGGGAMIEYEKYLTTRNIKYQTLAAKDFLFLVQHPDMLLSSLTFDIAPHPNQFPFTSFFGKIKRHLSSLRRLVKVWSFDMKFFENPIDPRTENQGLVMDVLPYLDMQTLNSIGLRVLDRTPDVTLNSPRLRECLQWRACQTLDIVHRKILINDFQQIAGFLFVEMMWQQNAYRELFEGLSNNILPTHEVTCHHPMIIRNRVAFEREIRQCRLKGILQENDVKLNFENMFIKYQRLGN